MKKISQNKGFTLIELMVVIAIIGIISVPIATYFTSNYITFNRENEKLNIQAEARDAMNTVITRLRRAEQSTIQINESGRLEMYVENDRYEFYQQNDVIKREVNSSSVTIARGVESFTYNIDDEASIVKIRIRIKGNESIGYALDIENKHKIRK